MTQVTTRQLPTAGIWIAFVPKTIPLSLRLAADGMYAGDYHHRNGMVTQHPFHHTEELRAPVEHVLAVGATESAAFERGQLLLGVR